MASSQADRLLILNQKVIAFGKANEVLSPDVLSEVYGGRITMFQKEDHMMIVSAFLGALSGVLGIYLAYHLEIATGPAIVLTITAMFAATFTVAQLRQQLN